MAAIFGTILSRNSVAVSGFSGVGAKAGVGGVCVSICLPATDPSRPKLFIRRAYTLAAAAAATTAEEQRRSGGRGSSSSGGSGLFAFSNFWHFDPSTMHKHKQRRRHALCPILGAQWAAVKLIECENEFE